MQNFLQLLREIQDYGVNHATDRTDVGRRRIFGNMMRFDMRNDQFPLSTTRQIPFNSVLAETLWFISGDTNNENLVKEGCTFWTPWAATLDSVRRYTNKLVERKVIDILDAKTIMDAVPDEVVGEIGPMYGASWRYWPRRNEHIRKEAVVREIKDMPSDFVQQMTSAYESLDDDFDKTKYSLDDWIKAHYYSHVDQLGELLYNLKHDPYGSRHLVTAYDPDMNPLPGFTPDENVIAEKGALMPCHYAFQVFVNPPEVEGGKPLISLMFNMRSWDVYLGGPFNIAGYGLILKMLAHCLDYECFELICVSGDTHTYFNQQEQIATQLSREPRALPKLRINPEKKDFFAITKEDFSLEGYDPHPAIPSPKPAV